MDSLPNSLGEFDEEDDELFEIDLDSVGDLPEYFWEESRVRIGATGKALLANCLMPVSDLSAAVPIITGAGFPFSGPGEVVMIGEPVPYGVFILQLSSFGVHK